MIQELMQMGLPYKTAIKANSHLPKNGIPYDYSEIIHYDITPTRQRRKRVMIELKFLVNGKENKMTFPARGSRWE